jgi:hypothetical protein
MTHLEHEDAFIIVTSQDDRAIALQRTKRSAAEAVRDLLLLTDPAVSVLTFDLSQHRWATEELAEWITEFKRLFHEMVINDGRATQLPTIAIFADHFTDEQEKKWRNVGAILFDRSLPCNHDCQNTDQFMNWLDRNKQITVADDGLKAPNLPKPPEKGISPKDLEALNSYPPGMTKETLNRILLSLNEQ